MRPVRELSILLHFMDRIMQVWTSLKSHLVLRIDVARDSNCEP